MLSNKKTEIYQLNKEVQEVVLQKIFTNKKFRKKYFEDNFYSFCKYYFSQYFTVKGADFHKQWIDTFKTNKHFLLIGFRESGKSIYLLMYLLWVFAYKKKRFILFYTFELSLASMFLLDLVNELKTNDKFVNDFGYLFPTDRGNKKDEQKTKSSMSEFITTNNIRVKPMSLSKSPRGLNYKARDGSFRPDLVCFDDIDIQKSVNSVELVDKNYTYLKSEVFGGLSNNARIIFLGNIISTDGIVPRVESEYSTSSDWVISRVPLIENGKILWNRFVLTDKERDEYLKKGEDKISIETKERLLGDEFKPNYLLIPNLRSGNPVFDTVKISDHKVLTPIKIDSKYKELHIFRKFDEDDNYYWGVDTSKGGIKGDFSVIVIRNQDGKLVATFQKRIQPDLLADVIKYIIEEYRYDIGKIVIESNNTGISTIDNLKNTWVSELLYREKDVDSITGKTKNKYGFNTNRKTKQLIIDSLEKTIRFKYYDGLDGRSIGDFLNYYYDDSGRTNALKGKFDDFVIAEALCYFGIQQGLDGIYYDPDSDEELE